MELKILYKYYNRSYLLYLQSFNQQINKIKTLHLFQNSSKPKDNTRKSMPTFSPYSPINNSPSKAQYSFGKSSRPSLGKKTYCDTFYQIPDTKSNRKASIGFGNKINWDDLNKSKKQIPAPTTYNPPDFVQLNKSSRKGYSSGAGRQETKCQSFVQFDPQIPGSQKYNIAQQNDAPKYSMRPRTASQTFVKKASKIIPAPNKYDPVSSINPEGKYCISKWQSSRSKRFDPSRSARFVDRKTQSPGPCNYTPRNSIFQGDGMLSESKYKSSGNRMFSTGNKSTIFEQEPKKFKDIPGPGMYEPFSDFGPIAELAGSKLNKTYMKRPASSGFYKQKKNQTTILV